MSDEANRITRINTQARVYFMDLGKKLDKATTKLLKSTGADVFSTATGLSIYGIDMQDVMGFNVKRNVTNSGPGTFQLTLSNRNDRYFLPDDPEEDIKVAAVPDPTVPDMGESAKAWNAYPYAAESGSYAAGFLNYKHFMGVQPDPDDAKQQIWVRKTSTGKYFYYNYSNYAHAKLMTTFSDEQKARMDAESRPSRDLYTKYEGNIRKANCLIEPMQYVSIWMPRRFPDKQGDLQVIFTGIVSTVSESWRDGQSTITVIGEDVTKWLRLNRVNMDPSLLTLTGVDEAPKKKKPGDYQEYKNKFMGLEGYQIIEKMVENVYNFSVIKIGNGSGQLDADLVTYDPLLLDTPSAWDVSVNDKVAKIFSKSKLHAQEVPADPEVDELLKDTKSQRGATEPIEKFSPYKAMFRTSPPVFESTYKDRLSICWDVAKLTDFVFYADAAGDLWYHQPRYDLGHILCAPNPEVYVLRDEAIIDWTFSETDDNMITRVRVFGLGAFLPSGQGEQGIAKGMFNIVEDAGLARYYGTREQTVEHPYVWSADQCAYYGRSLMRRMNADLVSGTVTITGRAEIQPGFPVYVPSRNKIYYIKSVDHSYTFGGQFTTTLGLAMGRRPWDVLTELLDYTGPADNKETKRRRDEARAKFDKRQEQLASRQNATWLRTGGAEANALKMWPSPAIATAIFTDEATIWSDAEKERWRLGADMVDGLTAVDVRSALCDYARRFKTLGKVNGENLQDPPLNASLGDRISYNRGYPENWYIYATDRGAYISDTHPGAVRLTGTERGMDCTTFLVALFAGVGILPRVTGGAPHWAKGGNNIWTNPMDDSFPPRLIPGETSYNTFEELYAAKRGDNVEAFYATYLRSGDVLVFGSGDEGSHVGMYAGGGMFYHCSPLTDSQDPSQPQEYRNNSAIHYSSLATYAARSPLTNVRRYVGGPVYLAPDKLGQENTVRSTAATVIGVDYIVPKPWKIVKRDS